MLYFLSTLYVKNISLLIFLLPKLKINFSIITTLGTIQYEFKNEIVMEMPEKFVIAMTNPLICYLIAKIDYTILFMVSKLIILGIKFEVLGETNFANNSPAKPGRQTKLDQYVSCQSKN